jgi:hypothetical protein
MLFSVTLPVGPEYVPYSSFPGAASFPESHLSKHSFRQSRNAPLFVVRVKSPEPANPKTPMRLRGSLFKSLWEPYILMRTLYQDALMKPDIWLFAASQAGRYYLLFVPSSVCD